VTATASRPSMANNAGTKARFIENYGKEALILSWCPDIEM
jgi:hypothetical protein